MLWCALEYRASGSPRRIHYINKQENASSGPELVRSQTVPYSGAESENLLYETGCNIMYVMPLPVTSIQITESLVPNAMALARTSRITTPSRPRCLRLSHLQGYYKAEARKREEGENAGRFPSSGRAGPAYE